MLHENTRLSQIKALYPQAQVVYTSDAGSILDTNIVDNTLTATAIYFEKSSVACLSEEIAKGKDSYTV